MEVFGKVSDIVLSREGTSQSTGNKYQIHTVVVQGSDNVCFEVFGTLEHLQKNGIVKGAEGKFIIKTEANYYNGKYYQRMSLDNIRNDFKPLGGAPKTEAQQQVEAVAQAAEAAKEDPLEQQCSGKAPTPVDDLPF